MPYCAGAAAAFAVVAADKPAAVVAVAGRAVAALVGSFAVAYLLDRCLTGHYEQTLILHPESVVEAGIAGRLAAQ